MVCRQVCCQRLSNGGLGIPDRENPWFAKRLAYLGQSLLKNTVWRQKASHPFHRLKSDPKAEGQRRPRGKALFVHECHEALHNFLLTWWFAQNMSPLFGLNYKAGLADMPDCPCYSSDLVETAERASSTILGSCRRVDSLHRTQAAQHWLYHRQCFASDSR